MTAQYRPLIMLAVGITFVYWIISLHSAPYPYPQNITVSREDLFGKIKPNGIFISVQDDWVYLTAIWKEHEVNYEDATGLIRQYRRPLHLILSHDNYDPNNNWQLLYNHRLEGPITHISSFYYNDGSPSTNAEYNENNALAILYQLHGKEEIKYIMRLYHIGNYETEISDTNDLGECQKLSPHTCHITPSFKYQDIILPGTTNIKSFHVDSSIILYSRSPDDVKFRTILMPENVFDISKSRVDALTLKPSDPGPIQKIGPLEPALRKALTFRRVYAVPGVIRVLNVEVTANDEIWTFQVTVIHNSSSSEETDTRPYRWRSKKLIVYTPSSPKKPEYDQYDFVRGIALIPPIAVPKPVVVTAKNVTTICIALSNILFTFDYSNTTSTDSSQQDTPSTEAYIVRSEYLPVLEESAFQVVGTEINANGNLLVLVTQENYILIYKRGDADANAPLSARARKGWFARLIDGDSRQNHINKQTEDNWELRMVISSSYLDFLSQSDLNVMAVKILNVSRLQSNGNILLNLYENGDIAAFDLDRSEQEMKFWFIIRKQWHMYIGMLCVVFAFVWNEMKMG